jgi:uncharacterized protein
MAWVVFISIAVPVLIILLVIYAYVYEVTNFTLSEEDIFVSYRQTDESEQSGREILPDKRHQKADGSWKDKASARPVLTILHLSDFHLRRNFKGRKLSVFVKSLSGLKPDFIFITGDLLGGDSSIDALIEMLSPLRSKLGSYAVFGVHDHYDKAFTEFAKNMLKRKKEYEKENDIPYLIRRLKEAGVEALINESRLLEPAGGTGSIEIIGLDDPVIEKIDINGAFSGIEPADDDYRNSNLQDKSTFKRIYNDVFKLNKEKIHRINQKGRLRIALMHTPDTGSIIKLAKRKTDIIFCGHTHGGQVRLPFIGALISGCRIKTKFASGLFYLKNAVLYVTKGLGEGKYSQFRFYCQPEASLVKIYRVN